MDDLLVSKSFILTESEWLLCRVVMSKGPILEFEDVKIEDLQEEHLELPRYRSLVSGIVE